jgi:CheY-like chemotaxis protein
MSACVLVVDDNDTDREAMAELLRREGFTVVTANDGRDALENPAHPNLVLLDMVMPSGFDGWFFLGQRRHHAVAEVPVVIVTGLAGVDESWASSLGVQGFIKKPLDVDRLMIEVRRQLRA